tara:strand:- start:2066 stop:2590 length:525 start_codon:yes stop_codon:yes gene_type:complete
MVLYRYNPSKYFIQNIKEYILNNKKSIIDNETTWKDFISRNGVTVEREIRILNNKEYTKDPYRKIYKSFIYYSNKYINDNTVKKKSSNNPKKIKLSKQFSSLMRNDIKTKLSKKYAKPSTAYDDFVKCYTQEITAEYNKMNGVEKKDLEKKIKRKYKDDYYYYYKKNYKYGYAE